MKPARSILDKSFAYVPSHRTDIGATFAKIYRDMQRDQKQPEPPVQLAQRRVGGKQS